MSAAWQVAVVSPAASSSYLSVRRRTLEGMGGWASTTWAARPRAAIVELMWLGLRDYRFETGSLWSAGVAAAAGWAVGQRAGPVTDRQDVPLTRELVTAELWAANLAIDQAPDGPRVRGGRPVALAAVVKLGVEWREPLPVRFVYADGVWRALRWLLGVEGQDAPFEVPLRRPDGSLVSADDLYAMDLAEAPWRYRFPEQRNALRDRAQADARRYRELAERVEDTIERVRAGSPALQL